MGIEMAALDAVLVVFLKASKGGKLVLLSKINSFGLLGIVGYPVSVEIDISGGLPAFELVGLPDAAVKEARERVRSALKNSGLRKF